MSLALLVVGTTIIATIAWYFLNRSEENNREEYARRNVKYLPQRNAFLQMVFKERLEEAKHEFFKQGHRIFGYNFLNAYTISAAEPELAQVVLSKEFTNFTNRRAFETNDPFFQNAISIVKDETWKRLRAVMTPTFSTGKLRRMKPLVDDTIRTLNKNMANAIKSSSDVNMKQIYGAFTMDTIIQVAFGTKVDSLVEPNNPVITYAKKLFSVDISFKNIIKFTMILMAPKLANFLKIRINPEVTDFFYKFSMDIINQKRKNMKNGNIGKANNFIELLLEAEVENEEEAAKLKLTEESNVDEFGFKKSTKYITNDELVAQCSLFFLAGYDTTATTLTMASYLLATNPDKQEKLYKEALSVLGKLSEEAGPDGSKDPVDLITLESLSRFEYLAAVVNETLRLYSPATFVEREVSKDMTIQKEDGSCKIHLKKNDIIQFPVYSMHRDPEQFSDPESFKPERFLGEPNFHKYAYIPFGSGPRNCIARSLALLEAKMALLHTIRQYKLSVSSKTKIPPDFYFQSQIIVPRDIILKVERR
ncbi:hypothetical protein RDWZM_009503 [Blomia tropicalis]|uniref:Uncharacterized protein n=1 Tax=Blomia tropicalis TaxID=40697 RepID=A0A9Q0RL48_BLOTA|nr:hypothetical protein RDWZM_009503 [Blomia tropicalis]